MKTKSDKIISGRAFWDTSGIIPLCLFQPQTSKARQILRTYGAIVAWWGTQTEAASAFNRLLREGNLNRTGFDAAMARFEFLKSHWDEVDPSEAVRDVSLKVLARYPLRAADALQLSAAIVWAGLRPKGRVFVCGDGLLSKAAEGEGFTVLAIK